MQEPTDQYRELFDSVPVGLYRTTPTGQIVAANPALAHMLGCPSSEALLAADVNEFYVASEQRGRWQAMMERGEAVRSFEGKMRRRDGTLIWVRGSARVVRDEQDKVLYYEGALEDITERKQAEDALRRYAEENARLYQAARQVDRLRVLNELDQALAATLDVTTIAEITLKQIAAAAHATKGLLMLRPVDRGMRQAPVFSLENGWVELDLLQGGSHPLRHLSKRFGEHRQAMLLPVEELAGALERPDLIDRWGSSCLGIPLWDGEELIGGIAIGGNSPDRLVTEDDRALVQAAASRAVHAIRNAWLYQASQAQAVRLETLNAVALALVSSLDTDTVLRQILDLTGQALSATAGSILLSNPNDEKLVFVMAMPGEIDSLRGRHIRPGCGIAGWAVQHSQAVLVEDVRQDERWYDGVDLATGLETRSLLCAPLKHRNKVMGVIEIVSSRTAKFSGQDLSLLESIASIAAAALDNARLYASMRSYADRLVLLHQIGQALTATLDVAIVVRAALHQVQRLFLNDAISVLRFDASSNELCLVQALVGSKQVETAVSLPVAESVAGWAVEHGEPVLIDDAQSDPRFSDQLDQHLGIKTRSLMAVPLLTPKRILGIIQVVSSEPGAFTRDELNTLQAIAATLAVALENARLYQELKTLLQERQQAQSQLIRSEKMAALGRLTASLAHEINNPLQALRSGFHLLLNPQATEEKKQNYLKVANREVERLIGIVERVLGFYRPSADRMEPTDINAILDETLLLAGKNLEHSQVVVQRQLADDLPPVEAVADQLRQVFLNIIFNAQQAMPQGGELIVATQWQAREGEAHISFTDTGVGIAAEQMPHLFEPFYTTRLEGTGLGLTISYSIVERHGGRIEVESQMGVGSTFAIILPVGLSRVSRAEVMR